MQAKHTDLLAWHARKCSPGNYSKDGEGAHESNVVFMEECGVGWFSVVEW